MYLLYDETFLEHNTGKFHPESPERLTSIIKNIKTKSWFKDLKIVKGSEIDLEILSLVHDRRYIEKVSEEISSGKPTLSTGDTDVCPLSNKVALNAAGGIVKMIDLIFTGDTSQGFCAVRPPGHHASESIGMGFCIYNNIAVAARYAQDKYGIEKVLILDWDVHHGNGTQDIFYKDNSVLFISTHQYPLYPGTGTANETGSGSGGGFTCNFPLPSGTGNREIIPVFKENILKAGRKFKPDLTLISAGFDSRKDDPIGGFEIDDNGFREMTRIALEIADFSGEGKLLSILEGGYNMEGLSSAVEVHIDEILKY